MFSAAGHDLIPSLKALDRIEMEAKAETQPNTAASYLEAENAPDKKVAVGVLIGEDSPCVGRLDVTADALEASGFETKAGAALSFPREEGLVVAVGLGEEADSVTDLRVAAAAFARAAATASDLVLLVPSASAGTAQIAALVEGILLSRHKNLSFKSEDDPKAVRLTSIALVLVGADEVGEDAAEEGLRLGRASAGAMLTARDLVTAPPGHLTPSRLGKLAGRLADHFGFEAEVLKRKQIEQLGCGGLLGVNRGSKYGPRLIKLSYVPEGADDSTKRLTMVGKGITFDSGGYSIKPAEAMMDMKMDMGGAAAVLGAFTGLKELGVPIKVDAYIPSTDNMISGDAMRIGEVLTAADGQTVEVNNTDAEGRLILMDALALGAEAQPDWMVDIATLTGAAMVALGTEMAALFSTSQPLTEKVEQAAEETGEDVWELPLYADYKKLLKSDVADMSNIGGRWGGALTAALFLEAFVGDTAWAHIDIAGPMSSDKEDGWLTKGATGYGARLLLALANDLGVDV